MYDTANYAATRLNNCLVWDRVVQKLFLVEACRGSRNITLVGHYPPESTIHEVPIDNFDFAFQKLGFTYHSGKSLYLMKRPMRRDWKQGLRASNVIVRWVENPRDAHGYDFRQVPISKVNLCVNGFKMDMDEAMEEAYNNEQVVPISRSFYLFPTSNVSRFILGHSCKGAVGTIVEGRAMLDEEHSYLTESYERNFNNAY